jgi:glutathione S-transferase
LHTVPLLVDEGRVVADSTAILYYLDRKVPAPPLWPAGMDGAEAFEFVALCDSVITPLSDLGMRYSALHDHGSFGTVRTEYVGRVQRALGRLAEKVTERRESPGLCGGQWSAADIAVCTLVIWLEALPIRAATFPPAKNVVSLGWTVPPELAAWAAERRKRHDVAALDAAP